MNSQSEITTTLCGIEIWSQSADHLIDHVIQRTESGESTFIVTLNPLMVMVFQNNPEFLNAVKSADIVVADGVGIRWAIRKLYGVDVPLIPGVELAEKLVQTFSQKQWGIALLGAKPGIWEKASGNLKEKYPGLVIAGGSNGYFSSDEESGIVDSLSEKNPKLLLAGMGFPKQENFLFKFSHRFKGAVLMGVGGTIDVFAGQIKRAPPIFRKTGLEWLWRIISEPRRLVNLFTLFRFWLMVNTRAGTLTEDRAGDCH